MSFVQRAITVVITAGPNTGITFGPSRENTLVLKGYRVSATIDYAGGVSMAWAQISVFGMNMSDMNALSSIAQPYYFGNKNVVSILAGDAESGMSLVFHGNLQQAVVNMAQAPAISFDMTAYSWYDLAMTPVPPASFSGAADVATIMSSIAAANGMLFENNGVSAVLSNPYFPGTALQQIKDCAQAAGINYVIDPVKAGQTGGPGGNGTLAIWPRFGNRAGKPPLISPQTGMIGYPRYTAYGIDVDMLFNPNLLFGGELQVQSSLTPACGTWTIYSISHSIECITKDGDWLTTASCWKPAIAKTQLGIG